LNSIYTEEWFIVPIGADSRAPSISFLFIFKTELLKELAAI
jgi:hypothetical protein